MAKKIIKAVKKAVKKTVVKKAVKKEVVKVAPISCHECKGTGLKDSNTLCPNCAGDGLA